MDAQGLLDDPSKPASPAAVGRLIDRMGFVQLDTITTVERAHHHILFSRLEGYRPAHLEHLHHRRRSLFEHITHDASLIPVRFFEHWRPRFERYRKSPRWGQVASGEAIREVVARIRERGPCMAREFEAADGRKAGPWWDWRPHKLALEWLLRTGELSVAARVSFQKVYDLTERVYPEAHGRPAPSPEEHIEWACSTALERLVIATPGELAAFWHAIKPGEAAAWAAAAVKSGAAGSVLVEGFGGGAARKALAHPVYRRRLARAAEPPRGMRLLSPFDPVIRDRKRCLRLFGFDYRFEAFVPAPKRRYGYYVLPILEGDRLVGRADPKLHRDRGVLEIQKFWWEPGYKAGRAQRKTLEAAVAAFAAFTGAARWTLPDEPSPPPQA